MSRAEDLKFGKDATREENHIRFMRAYATDKLTDVINKAKEVEIELDNIKPGDNYAELVTLRDCIEKLGGVIAIVDIAKDRLQERFLELTKILIVEKEKKEKEALAKMNSKTEMKEDVGRGIINDKGEQKQVKL